MKRFVCAFLAFALLLTMFPLQAKAVTGGKLAAITFDDGPGPYTAELLDGLKARGVKATFFLLGYRVASYSTEVQRMLDEGHEIASHGWDHTELTSLSVENIKSQFSRSYEALAGVVGGGLTYLTRAPYGSESDKVHNTVNTPFIYWSNDTRDWESLNADKVCSMIHKYTKDGSVILLHDIHKTSVKGALAGIDKLLAEGYEFVTVSELFRRRGVTMENGVRYYNCPPTGTDLGPVQKPVVSYAPGEADGTVVVTITAQQGTTIYYNTDGSKITQNSKIYNGPFLAKVPVQVNAIAAFKFNGSRSDLTEYPITLPYCSKPLAELDSSGNVVLTSTTPGASVFYTLGSQQVPVRYDAPIGMVPGTWITAYSTKEGYLPSQKISLFYSHSGNLFADVGPDDWYYSYIDYLADQGLMNGTGNNMFAPQSTLDRAMMATLLYRLSGESAKGDGSGLFPDVNAGAYYAEAVDWACDADVIRGYDDGTFKPENRITREEMAVMIARYLRYMNREPQGTPGVCEKFNDADKISDWALKDVEQIVTAEILRGDDLGKLNPGGNTTRAEAAAVLVRVMDYCKG